MAILTVKRQTIKSYSMDLHTELQATEYYLVIADGPISPIDAETATGVPKAGDSHPDDPKRLLKQKRPQCLDNANRTHWEVQVDFSSLIDTQPNPLLRPAQFSWDYDNATETYFHDHASEYEGATDGYGEPITGDQTVTNRAGETFEKLPERDAGTWSATYTKNVAPTFTIAKEIDTMQVVNKDEFEFDGENIAPFAAKISGGSLSAVQTESGFQYRTLAYKVKFKNGGWIDHFANVGFQQMDSGKRVPIVSGAPNTQAGQSQRPWPLDQDGVAYPDPTTAADSLNFYPYHTMSFAGLFTG